VAAVNAYVIQRICDGAYMPKKRDIDATRDPHEAYKFGTREAAQQYMADFFTENSNTFHIAILPATRPLLSVPQERAA
jgi:hypothetical protein